MRHNGRVALDEMPNSYVDVPPAVIDELNKLICQLGKSLASDKSNLVRMAEAAEIVDLPMERRIDELEDGEPSEEEDGAATAGSERPDDALDSNEDGDITGGEMIDVREVGGEVSDFEPETVIGSLEEVRHSSEKLFDLISESSQHVDSAAMMMHFNIVTAMDIRCSLRCRA